MSIKDEDFLKHIKDITGSDSLCLAKWYNATIWLGSGQTTSCHHPAAHAIPDEVVDNPKLLHNTEQKKDDRRLMQLGERPLGCDYCWKIEDKDSGAISDRVYKSKIFDEKDLQDAKDLDFNTDVDLKTLEISFDRTCNFACSYCNPAFSTTWVKDIKANGPYENMIGDGRKHFTHTHDSAQKYMPKDNNPYVDAFWEWWESDLKNSLQELRITGGEPLMSGEVWKLLEWYDNYAMFHTTTGDPAHPRMLPALAINSNLGCDREQFEKLINYSRSINNFDLYTSCEATFEQADYIRDGLNYDEWLSRMDALLFESQFRHVHVMCTINALSLFSLTDFLDTMLMFKAKDNTCGLSFTLNILRFPSFQSPLVLPEELLKHRRQDLQMWFMEHAGSDLLEDHEFHHVYRLIEYLTPEKEPDDVDALRHDFKQFYTQYDKRRGKNFEQTFPVELVDWYKTL